VNDKELEEVLGTIGFREYNAAPEHAREEVREFAATVRELSDAEFVLNAAYRIEESARWGSVRGTHWNGIHAMASGCYTESQRRLEAEGVQQVGPRQQALREHLLPVHLRSEEREVKAQRYDYVQNFRSTGWRVFRVGPQGGQTTMGVYSSEEAAQRIVNALNKERSFEL
jgi:hypothetical protein